MPDDWKPERAADGKPRDKLHKVPAAATRQQVGTRPAWQEAQMGGSYGDMASPDRKHRDATSAMY
jgi:hypothetical protein